MLIKLQSIKRKLGLEGRETKEKQKDATCDNICISSRSLHSIYMIEDENQCKNLCDKAYLDCLHATHEHVVEYMDRHIIDYQKWQRKPESDHDEQRNPSTNGSASGCDNSDNNFRNASTRSYCSYENWIRECHPENTCQGDSVSIRLDEKLDKEGYEIDSRFYLSDSDHRIIWNAYVKAYECPELCVDPVENDNGLQISEKNYHEGAITVPRNIQNTTRIGEDKEKQERQQ